MARTRTRQTPRAELAAVSTQLAGTSAAVLADHLARLRTISNHPNRLLHYDQLLVAHLLGFYDPAVRSLRTLDARSVADASMREALHELRVARSTISDAMGQLPAEALLPLMKQLLDRLPANRSQPDLADLMTLKKRILAIDGSYFRVPADVLWALSHRRPNGKLGRQVRLDLHLDVLRFLPVKAQLDGEERGGESAAFIGTLDPGVVYLADRNFVDFDFLASVIRINSDFVVRLKSSSKVVVTSINAITPRDIDAGVSADQQVTIESSRWASDVPGPLRVVTVFDPVRRQDVRLLTTLTDVPAELIGQLYRHRWSIELFFRWLKCVARIKHLFGESSNGITMQFYVVIIATLLMHLQLGHRPSVYTYQLLSIAARGDLVLEKVPEVLERLARERELERLRRAKKKAK